MSVYIEYSVDYLGYKVVRTRHNGMGGIEYLSSKGWVTKDKTKPVVFDETTLWDIDDFEEFQKKVSKIKPYRRRKIRFIKTRG